MSELTKDIYEYLGQSRSCSSVGGQLLKKSIEEIESLEVELEAERLWIKEGKKLHDVQQDTIWRANRLAYACAIAVQNHVIGSRSAISDELLEFLGVGCVSGPRSVPEWMEAYEQSQKTGG